MKLRRDKTTQNSYVKNIAIAVVFILSCMNVCAQWVQTSTVGWLRSIYCMTVKDSTLFASTEWGVFRSINGGVRWEAADSGFPYELIQSQNKASIKQFTISGENLFAVANNGVVYRSSNDGTSWLRAGGLPAITTNIAVTANVMYAGKDSTLYYSTNNGDSWGAMSSGSLPSFAVSPIAVYNNYIFAASVGNNTALFRSSDGGTNWQNADNGLPALTQILAFVINSGTIFASITYEDNTNGGHNIAAIYRSSDNGANWSRAENGITTDTDNTYITYIGTHNSEMVAVLYYTEGFGKTIIYHSTNNGDNWTIVASDSGRTYTISSLVFQGNNIFAGTVSNSLYADEGLPYIGNGVILSTDNGAHWVGMNNDLTNMPVIALTAAGNRILSAMEYEPLGISYIYFSSDNGVSWSDTNLGSHMWVFDFGVTDSGIYAGSIDGIFLSTDNGRYWHLYDSDLADIYDFTIIGNTIFASSANNAYRSTDEGVHWHPYSIFPSTANAHAFFAAIDSTYPKGGTVYRSTNNGNTWFAALCDGFPDQSIIALAACDENLVASTDSGIYVSTNDGDSWLAVMQGDSVGGVFSFAVDSMNIFGVTKNRVFLSRDKGLHWSDVGGGLPYNADINLHTLKIDNGYLFIGTNYTGIWRRPLSDFGINSVSESIPLPSNALLSNYPNPFSGTTNIELQTPIEEPATLKIYNMLGREVADLTKQLIPGSSTVQFNAAGLQPGVYFCKGVFGAREFTSKLVIIK